MNKLVKFLIFVLILLTLTSCGTNLIAIGERAPNFTLRNLGGEEVSLKDNRGKAVLLNFWGVWCPPCTIEMPDIIDRSERYKDDLVVMAVNYGDSLKKIIDFTEEIGMTFMKALINMLS